MSSRRSRPRTKRKMPTPIIARKPYSPPQVGSSYDPQFLRTQLALIAQAISPTITRTVTAATTIAATDDTILCDTTAGNFPVTLLPPGQVQFLKLTLKNIGPGIVTLNGTIDGVVNPTLAVQYATKTIQSDGVAWYLLSVI